MSGWVGAQRKLQAGGKVIPAEARYVQFVKARALAMSALQCSTTKDLHGFEDSDISELCHMAMYSSLIKVYMRRPDRLRTESYRRPGAIELSFMLSRFRDWVLPITPYPAGILDLQYEERSSHLSNRLTIEILSVRNR